MQIVVVPMFADGDAKTLGLLFDGSNAPDSRDESGDQTRAEDTSDTQGNDERDSAGPDLTSGPDMRNDRREPAVRRRGRVGRQVDTGWDLTAVSDMESGIGSVILIWTGGDASIMVRIMKIGRRSRATSSTRGSRITCIAENVHEGPEVLPGSVTEPNKREALER